MVIAKYPSTKTEQQLRQITYMLLLNGTLVGCSGLIHGKMGIAIFFFFCARHTGNGLFEEYALDLIGEIQEQIHANSPTDYKRGIAGIGVGIDYLIRNNFLDADDDIFDDFDQRMYRAVMYDPWQDFSLYDGLIGYGKYWISRLCQNSSNMQAQECLLFITRKIEQKLSDISETVLTDVYCFIHDLQKISDFYICIGLWKKCQKLPSDNCRSFFRLGDSSVGNIIRKYQYNHYFGYTLKNYNDSISKQIQSMNMEKPPVNMGLLTGYAGEGLLRLTVINKTDMSWMLLF